MRVTSQELKALRELLRPFIEMGLVEVTVAPNGEVLYGVPADVTEEMFLAALVSLQQKGEQQDA